MSISAFVALCSIETSSAFSVVKPSSVGLGYVGQQSDVSSPPSVATSARTTALQAMRRGGGAPRGRAPTIQENRPTMNEEIQAAELRVVTPTAKGKDEPLGVMSKAEALAKAKEMGNLDLILINNNSDPPVCKIVDYSKYRYMQEKKAKEVKKNSKATEIKEVKMSYKIDVHDYDVRKKSALKFLNQGNRVKCTVMFRGREVQHDNLGFELLAKLSQELDDLASTEGRPKREGKNLSLILSPRVEVMKALNDKKRKLEREKKKEKEQELAERKASKDVSGLAAGVVASEGLNGESLEDSIIDMESSLDDLLGGSDDLTDDIFS